MKLVFLGRYRELAGAVTPPGDIADLAALRAWLAQAQPVLAKALEGNCAIVINQRVVRNPHHPVADNDEIAFLPPMSGG